MKIAAVEDVRIAYREEGAGETVLLVHGVTTASFIWNRVVPLLAPDYHVVAVDLLCCGASEKPVGADVSLRRQAGLLAKLASSAGWGPVHLVGHDVGGGIAQILTVRSPGLVRDLALLNTVGYDYWPVQPIITLRTPIVRQLAMSTLDAGVLRILIGKTLHHKEKLTDELLENVRQQMSVEDARRPFLHFVRCLDNRDLMEIVDELGRIAVPTLILRGDRDVFLSAEISDRLNRDIPGSRLVRIATAGHYIQQDEPELVAGNLRAFFAENRGG